MFYVYWIVVDDGYYVGSTGHIEARIARHLNELVKNIHHNVNLQAAYNKTGGEFTFVTQNGFSTREDAYDGEQHMIDMLTACNFKVYNITAARGFGDALTHHPNREEIIARRSLTLHTKLDALGELGRKKKYGRVGENNGMYGRTHTPEVRSFLSRINKGRPSPNKGVPLSDDVKAKLSAKGKLRVGPKNGFYGRQHSEETKQRISAGKVGKPMILLQKPFYIGNDFYRTLQDASNATGIHVTTIRHRLVSPNPKFKHYYYENTEEK